MAEQETEKLLSALDFEPAEVTCDYRTHGIECGEQASSWFVVLCCNARVAPVCFAHQRAWDAEMQRRSKLHVECTRSVRRWAWEPIVGLR